MISRRKLYAAGEPLGNDITRRVAGRMIFGGGGDSGGGGSSTSVTQNYSPEEAARRTAVMDEATRVYGATKDAIAGSAYPGSKPVPFSAETTAAQNMAVQAAGNVQPQIDAINRGVQFGLTDAMDVRSNPYLQSAIQSAIAPITQAYSGAGGALSQIRSGANESGQFGGSRQGIAEGLAASNYMGQVGNTAATMANQGYQSGLDTFSKTLAFAPSAIDAAMTPVNWLSSVGAQKESLDQANADYAGNQAAWQMNAPWLGLQNYANIVFGAGSNGGTTTTTGASGGTSRNPLMAGLGGAAMGASLAPMLGMTGPVGAGIGALMSLM